MQFNCYGLECFNFEELSFIHFLYRGAAYSIEEIDFIRSKIAYRVNTRRGIDWRKFLGSPFTHLSMRLRWSTRTKNKDQNQRVANSVEASTLKSISFIFLYFPKFLFSWHCGGRAKNQSFLPHDNHNLNVEQYDSFFSTFPFGSSSQLTQKVNESFESVDEFWYSMTSPCLWVLGNMIAFNSNRTYSYNQWIYKCSRPFSFMIRKRMIAAKSPHNYFRWLGSSRAFL